MIEWRLRRGGEDEVDGLENTRDLRVLLKSRHPLIYVETKEEDRFLRLLRLVAGDESLPVWVWSSTSGLARDGANPQYKTTDLGAALDFIGDLTQPAVFVLADAESALHDTTTLRRLKECALGAKPSQTIIISGSRPSIPPEVGDLAHVWTLALPSRMGLRDLAARTIDDFSVRGFKTNVTKQSLDALADSLIGMTMREAERAIQRVIVEDGIFDSSDIDAIRSLKADLLNQDGILELITAEPRTLDQIGGLEELKKWLRIRGSVFRGEAGTAGLDLPKGVLLTGVPGCGKSLVAKTIAATWGMPLILLDPARLYGKFVGESEQRLASALETIDAMSPAVVWIDEIEKGFATGEDGGVSRRILGTFLRWLQDRSSQIFVVATANDVTALPPEILRRGRLDETFFVDLPDLQSRKQILTIHLLERGHDPSQFDTDDLAAAMEGYSGAEIETVVVGAMYTAFGDKSSLTQELLDAEVKVTVPLSVSRSEDISRLREWAGARTVAA